MEFGGGWLTSEGPKQIAFIYLPEIKMSPEKETHLKQEMNFRKSSKMSIHFSGTNEHVSFQGGYFLGIPPQKF